MEDLKVMRKSRGRMKRKMGVERGKWEKEKIEEEKEEVDVEEGKRGRRGGARET